MLVKMGSSSPKFGVTNKKNLKPPPGNSGNLTQPRKMNQLYIAELHFLLEKDISSTLLDYQRVNLLHNDWDIWVWMAVE